MASEAEVANQKKGEAARRFREEGVPYDKKKKRPRSSAKARPRRASAKAKAKAAQDAPSLSSRPIWAFLRILVELMFLPTKMFLSIILQAVMARIRFVWKEVRWLSYYQREYLQKAEVRPGRADLDPTWLVPWWTGVSSRALRARPATQAQRMLQALHEKLLGCSAAREACNSRHTCHHAFLCVSDYWGLVCSGYLFPTL